MTSEELYAEVRLKIGDPGVNEISNRRLMSYVVPALEWFAGEMEYRVKEDDHILTLTADQATYLLPEEVLSVLWIAHNNIKLEPASHNVWDRDGAAWRNPTSGVPAEFAVHGRQVILQPPPSAAAIATDPAMTLRYIAGPEGVLGLSELDQWLVIHEAAILWCGDHEEDQFRLTGLNRFLTMNLENVKRQHENRIENFQPGFQPRVRRQGAAR